MIIFVKKKISIFLKYYLPVDNKIRGEPEAGDIWTVTAILSYMAFSAD